jgi:ribosome biogenesis GTPase
VPAETTLTRLGWTPAWAQELDEIGCTGTPARVTRLDRGWAIAGGDELPEGRFPVRGGPEVAVGDWVCLADASDGVAAVSAVLPRRSALARRASDGTATAQVLAANVDTVALVHALSTPFNEHRLERELVLAFASGADPVVLLSKADLVDDATVSGTESLVDATAPGVAVLVVSSMTGRGLDAVRALGAGHRTLALLGASGVGKSTLVNRLAGEERQRTAEVRAFDGKGRHTTTAAELVALPGGGLLVDTPGLRAIALWDAEHGLERAFPEIAAAAERCMFDDCTHESEPLCEVRILVESGEIDERRLASFHNLAKELAALQRDVTVRVRAAGRGRRRPPPEE